MTTTKKRINISVSKDMENILAQIAKRDQVPQATKIQHLLKIALEMEEDFALNEIALTRDVPGQKLISHEDAWK